MRSHSLFVASLFFAFVAILFHPTAGAPAIFCPACPCRRRAPAGRSAPRHPDRIKGFHPFTAAQFPEIDWNSEASRAARAGNGVTHAVPPDWVHQVAPCVNWESNIDGPMFKYSAHEMPARGMIPNGNGTKTMPDVTDFLPRSLAPWLPSTLLEPFGFVTLYRGTTVSGFRALQSSLQGGKTLLKRSGWYGQGLYFTTDPAVARAFARDRAEKESELGFDDPAGVLKITVRPRQLECWAPHKAVLENEEDRVWPFLEFVLREEEQKNVVLDYDPLREAEQKNVVLDYIAAMMFKKSSLRNP